MTSVFFSFFLCEGVFTYVQIFIFIWQDSNGICFHCGHKNCATFGSAGRDFAGCLCVDVSNWLALVAPSTVACYVYICGDWHGTLPTR